MKRHNRCPLPEFGITFVCSLNELNHFDSFAEIRYQTCILQEKILTITLLPPDTLESHGSEKMNGNGGQTNVP